jgi:hypothetical protein
MAVVERETPAGGEPAIVGGLDLLAGRISAVVSAIFPPGAF